MRASALAAAETGVLAVPASLTREEAMAGLLCNARTIRARRVLDVAKAIEIGNNDASPAATMRDAGYSPAEIRRVEFERLRAAGIARIGKG